MKTFELVLTETLSEITCDRCKAVFVSGDQAWYEIQSIEYVAGYGSIFGDGNTVSIDLCQECLKQTLGQWLRVEPHRRFAKAGKISERTIEALRHNVEKAVSSHNDQPDDPE